MAEVVGLVLFVLTPLLIFLLVLVIQDRRSSATIADLEAGGERRDKVLADLAPKTLGAKLRAAGIHSTKRVGRPIRVKIKAPPVEPHQSPEPFSDSRASRLN